MTDYPTLTAQLQQEAELREDALPIRNAACRSRFWLHPQPRQRVCLFFHGFTAGSYQYWPMGEALFKSGYNVLAPRLPGHGRAGDWNSVNPSPLPISVDYYQSFAMEWLSLAQSLGQQVIVGGLSGGGTIATWLAYECPESIYRVLAFAPYLSSSSRLIDLFTNSSNSYFEWKLPQGSPPPVGYSGFNVPALRVFLHLGKELLVRARKTTPAPIFIVSSESDRAVNNTDHQTLWQSALEHQPLSWYHIFNRVLEVPHTMMTTGEGNQYQNLLITLTKAFIESNVTWAEIQQIGERLIRGQLFEQAVTELNLKSKVSGDMPAMMTMVDKRSLNSNSFTNRLKR
ncbi:MAG: alpha/beta fold hydrolase [Cyanobacteria bacterium REEB444]|nr:alpha/beta fold hydrolase [Cyanobacteria bacterium REEB444]